MRHAALCALSVLLLAARAQAEPIAGRVVDEGGKPIADATIVVESSGASVPDPNFKPARSDAQGRFSVDVTANPMWPDWLGRATAFAPGYGIGGVSLGRGDKANVLRLGAPTSASGVVRDAQGQPVAGVQLYVGSISPQPRAYISISGAVRDLLSATSGADGKWKIEHLPRSGSATVVLEDQRFERAFVTVALTATSAESPEITARAGASISGRVLDETGKPLANIALSASSTEQMGDGHSAATSDAEGRFTLFSLPAGLFGVALEDRKKERVSPGLSSAKLQAGGRASIGDIVMKPGALISGTAMDNEGKPIAGVQVNARLPQDAGRRGTSWDATTDAAGRYSLRVPQGDVLAFVSSQPRQFLAPRLGGNYTDHQIPLQVAEGATVRRDWVLQRGSEMQVQVLAEGKPLPQAVLKLQGDPKDPFAAGLPEEATTDARGQARFVSLRPGEYTPLLEDGWEVVAPLKIVVGEGDNGALQVRVKRLDLPTLRGRVLTGQGEPVAGATVRFTAYRELGEGRSIGDQQREATTGADGRYEIARFKPEKRMDIRADKASHRKLNTVQITSENGAFSVPDILLAPLDQTARGRVLDERNQPVAGAQVLAPEGDSDAVRTGADGRFALKMLPRGQVRIVAASAGAWAEATIDSAKNEDAMLSLRPMPEMKASDVFRAHEILDEVKSQSQGKDYFARDVLGLTMAPFDFELALELSGDADGRLSEQMRAFTFMLLSKASPERAIAIAEEQLAQVKSPERQAEMLVALGQSTASRDPEFALEIWQRLQVLVVRRARTQAAPDARLALGVMELAYALKLPERAKYLEEARRILQPAAGEGTNSSGAMFAISLARIDVVEAEKILRGLGGAGLVQALSNAIPQAAQHDSGTALQWLDWLGSLPPKNEAERTMNADPKWAFGQASLGVIRALGAKDAAGALALARRVESPSWRARALAEAAKSQPKPQAMALLREAAAMAAPYVNDDTPIVIAARALEVDQALGRELLSEKKALYESKSGGEVNRLAAMTLPSWAFYYARVDRAASKMILEQAWARRNGDTFDTRGIALAMAACDIERAVQMARALPEPSNSFDTRRKLAQYILADEETRRSMPFERWGRGDTWMLGDDE